MSVTITKDPQNGLPKVEAVHSSGATMTIYKHGATVTSLKCPAGQELIFMSSKAIWTGAKAFRGGIPVCWPQFGPGKLAQHGFARNTSAWEFSGADVSADGSLSIVFKLEDTVGGAFTDKFPHKFCLLYTLVLDGSPLEIGGGVSLKCYLKTINIGGSLPFQALLHTYHRVSDISKVSVNGYEGLKYLDKVTGGDDLKEETAVDKPIDQFIDSVYIGPEIKDGMPNKTLVINPGNPGEGPVTVSRAAYKETAAGKTLLPCDAVLWNLWEENAKKMGDMDDDGYTHFVCVEPGLCVAPGNECILNEGETATLYQSIVLAPTASTSEKKSGGAFACLGAGTSEGSGPILHCVEKKDIPALLCAWVGQVAKACIAKNGKFTIALSGGSLPNNLVALSQQEGVDFSKWHVFFADERCVPLDSKDSNFKACNDNFFSKVAIPSDQIYKIDPSLSPAGAAEAYTAALQKVFGEFPRFDLCLLGMGPDGHTCSLFPGHPLLHQNGWCVPIEDSPKPPACRITLTREVVNNSALVGFVAAGASKVNQMPEMMGVESNPLRLPASLINPTSGELHWWIDTAAGEKLPETMKANM